MYQIVTYYYEDEEKIEQVYTESKHLWGEHVCYTRNAIISLLNGTSDIDAVSTRLMQNQDEIAELVAESICSTCNGTGVVEVMRCTNGSNECCGGCYYEEQCEDCNK